MIHMKRPLPVYFSIIYRHGRVMHDKAMKQFGITGQQMGYIRWIGENPGISQEALARRMQIDKGAVAKAVGNLVEKGFVERRKNPDDRRAYCLFPTEKARNIRSRIEQCARRIEGELFDGLTPEETELFENLLGRVTENMMRMLEGGKL